VSAENLSQGIKEHGHKSVVFMPEFEQVVDHLLAELKPGDVVLTLGAGDIWKVGKELLQRLRGK
jgi:UDP-N-acetylmuramate--alanine ligase